jgi:D-alanyl-D-alanine carboxypeptidase
LQTPLANVVIRNNLKLNAAPCASWEKSVTPPVALNDDNGDIEIRLNGSFPKNCQVSTRLNLMDRNQYVAAMFAQIWRELGGVWRGQVREAKHRRMPHCYSNISRKRWQICCAQSTSNPITPWRAPCCKRWAHNIRHQWPTLQFTHCR